MFSLFVDGRISTVRLGHPTPGSRRDRGQHLRLPWFHLLYELRFRLICGINCYEIFFLNLTISLLLEVDIFIRCTCS